MSSLALPKAKPVLRAAPERNSLFVIGRVMLDNGSNAFMLCSPSDRRGDFRADMVGDTDKLVKKWCSEVVDTRWGLNETSPLFVSRGKAGSTVRKCQGAENKTVATDT